MLSLFALLFIRSILSQSLQTTAANGVLTLNLTGVSTPGYTARVSIYDPSSKFFIRNCQVSFTAGSGVQIVPYALALNAWQLPSNWWSSNNINPISSSLQMITTVSDQNNAVVSCTPSTFLLSSPQSAKQCRATSNNQQSRIRTLHGTEFNLGFPLMVDTSATRYYTLFATSDNLMHCQVQIDYQGGSFLFSKVAVQYGDAVLIVARDASVSRFSPGSYGTAFRIESSTSAVVLHLPDGGYVNIQSISFNSNLVSLNIYSNLVDSHGYSNSTLCGSWIGTADSDTALFTSQSMVIPATRNIITAGSTVNIGSTTAMFNQQCASSTQCPSGAPSSLPNGNSPSMPSYSITLGQSSVNVRDTDYFNGVAITARLSANPNANTTVRITPPVGFQLDKCSLNFNETSWNTAQTLKIYPIARMNPASGSLSLSAFTGTSQQANAQQSMQINFSKTPSKICFINGLPLKVRSFAGNSLPIQNPNYLNLFVSNDNLALVQATIVTCGTNQFCISEVYVRYVATEFLVQSAGQTMRITKAAVGTAPYTMQYTVDNIRRVYTIYLSNGLEVLIQWSTSTASQNLVFGVQISAPGFYDNFSDGACGTLHGFGNSQTAAAYFTATQATGMNPSGTLYADQYPTCSSS